ncbi:MoaD/ThiS family protein [Porphyrobacter sp. HT-58-2]|uniref:MoaD/ThiS family protein n=1 Tax=Porphyrobacter sp. HT-58-2 TaxID=2023229 RepID=UPI001F39EAB0|nr:MoaD/ThiS family protein [Porphyrobacter sp. HT-58-2]
MTVVPLGKLADLAGAPSLSLAGPLDWAGLKAALPAALAEALDDPRNRIAVNGALLADKAALRADEGDEIALLPPVSGG